MASVNAPAPQNPTDKEIKVHCQVVDYLDLKYGNQFTEPWYHHSANEGKRTNGYVLKRMGMSKGFPDLFIFVPNKFYHGLAIELKREKDYHISDAQRDWINALNRRGYKASICKGYDEAVKVIDEYMKER